MSVTVATMVQSVRDILNDNPFASPFTGNINSSTTTVPVADGTKWDKGAILEFQDDGEQCYVQSVSGNNLTVFRGFNGTTGAAHDGSVTPIVVLRDPEFTYIRIQGAIVNTCRGLWPHVWNVGAANISYSVSSRWYELHSSAIDLIDATQEGTESSFVNIYKYGVKGGRRIILDTAAPTALITAGVAVAFPDGFYNRTNAVRVRYRARYEGTISSGSFTEFSDDEYADMIAYGAAARLVSLTEVDRVVYEDTSQADATIQAGQRVRAGAFLKSEFLEKRDAIHDELLRTARPMKTWRS